MKLYLVHKTPLANFLSSWSTGSLMKEVLARSIQMNWIFACTFICPNQDSPPSFNSIQSSMWAEHQFLVSGHIFQLWSNYILYCFIIAENLPEHYPTHITYLHNIWAHFIFPIIPYNFSKILVREDICEGSTILACPNGIKILQNLHMTK